MMKKLGNKIYMIINFTFRIFPKYISNNNFLLYRFWLNSNTQFIQESVLNFIGMA